MDKARNRKKCLPLYIAVSLSLTLVLLAFAGCSRTDSHPPVIFSVTAEPDIVPPGQASTLTVEAGDMDRDELSYLWTVSAGSIEGSGKTVMWLSPEVEGQYQLTVTVSDGSDSVAQTVTVWVWAPRPGDYYTLEVGNTWTFQDNNDDTIEFEIIDTIDISGTTAFVKETTTSALEGVVNYSYVAKNSDGVYQHAVGGYSVGDDTIIFSPELPIYKFPLIPGESWEVEFDVELPGRYPVGNGTAIYEVLSEEDLTVEAGSFQHVFQVKEDFTWGLFGQELDHSVSYQWLAPNVGMVKFTMEQTRGGQTVATEAILQSYSLK